MFRTAMAFGTRRVVVVQTSLVHWVVSLQFDSLIKMATSLSNSGLTSHQQRDHTETKPWFKVSTERPGKRDVDLATPRLVG